MDFVALDEAFEKARSDRAQRSQIVNVRFFTRLI
jgi:hypothetical protein